MRSWLLLFTFVFALFSQAGEIQVDLRSQTVVSGPKVTLGEIAAVKAGDPSTLKRLSELPVVFAPPPGRHLSIYPGIVLAKLKTAGYDQGKIDFHAPDTISVVTESQIITGESMVSAATEFVKTQHPDPDVQCIVKALRKPKPMLMQTGACEFLPHLNLPVPRCGRITVAVDVHINGQRARTVFVPIQISVVSDVWVTEERIRRGQALSASQLSKTHQESTTTAAESLPVNARLEDYRPRQDIPAGSVLTLRNTERIPVVEQGHMVQVELLLHGIKVLISGKALNSAGYGEDVEIMNRASGKRIKARVTSPGLARVLLE